MIPSVLAHQVRQGIEDFLRTTFPVSTPFFGKMLDGLLEENGSVFKGPFFSLQLPYKKGSGGSHFFPDVPLGFTPYLHQEQAFKRLGGINPSSTIVATGTGSGKTECYLYPILNHCYRHRHERGVKAILIYPMNALASDQAERLAKIVANNPELKENVTAGLFVGQREKHPNQCMGPRNIITDKDTMRLMPPDILLTNYKMLDYLLIRPKDFPLWKQNGPKTLRYLVVDELHTFDGAQGTDLACLIRRLKARLGTPDKFLCCTGTSATLGTEDEQADLRDYAEHIFGESFDEDCIIKESMLDVQEFIGTSDRGRFELVPVTRSIELDPRHCADYSEYIRAQHRLWFNEPIPESQWNDIGWRIALADKLKDHRFLRYVLNELQNGIYGYDEMLSRLRPIYIGLAESDEEYQSNLLLSFLALVSEARIPRGRDDGESNEPIAGTETAPFLNVRVQYWLRELRRMVGEVSNTPRLRFADDLTDEQLKHHLPVMHCRECGAMGWAGTKRKSVSTINSDLKSFYISYFAFGPNVVFLFPEDGDEEYARYSLDGEYLHLCASCLTLTKEKDPQQCPSCSATELVFVFMPDSKVKRNDRLAGIHNCPYCGTQNSMTILGSRAASLTSVLIAQLYSSNFNDDKKLLAFSDSVQDASHRAGFFAARTYRFNFRTALQQFVDEKGAGLSLREMPGAFINFYSKKMKPEEYIAHFLPPDMEWLEGYQEMLRHGRLPPGSSVRSETDHRVGWEIFSEYGFRSRIGRTLEKTGSSILHVDPAKLETIVEQVLEILENEIEPLRGLEEDNVRQFVLGIFIRLKSQGGIHHTALERYIKDNGNAYAINKYCSWMPNFGSKTRAPVFLTTRPGTRSANRFDQLPTPNSKDGTWYYDWAEKCFLSFFTLVGEEIPGIYKHTVQSFEREGLFEVTQEHNHKFWGLKPDALIVGRDVAQFRCDVCEHSISMADHETAWWEGAPCLRFRCRGRYRWKAKDRDYYRDLYGHGDLQRIFAAEHTGLLDRDAREELERRFKTTGADRNPWDPNLLSCTPTLEMGIDVGDLSSVILCSVPPAQANYLQRIGRSGRRAGNALNLTVANGRPHDLFFFSEPKELIAGRVEPPGVFLNAPEVLKRQLTAFCFDRWVESGVGAEAVPAELGPVLSKLHPVDNDRFPHNFLYFISNHRTKLLEDFLALFGETLSDAAEAQIAEFMKGDKETDNSLPYRIVEGLNLRKTDLDSLRNKIKDLNKKVREMEKHPAPAKDHDERVDELKREKECLQSVVKRIRKQNTFNFFTDEGLIPNYAFPEAGVMLRSIIYRKKQRPAQSGFKYDSWTEQYQRSASSAIDELAPDNRFYAGGRKVQIDQIDLRQSDIETWRLCDNCSYAELMGRGTVKSVCPRCGSAMWADEGRKRPMIRMRQVFATTSDRESRIADDSDDREPSFYHKQMLVDFEDKNVTEAYKLDTDDLPFGFEFLSKADFREINFGEQGEGGETMKISGIELPRKGFAVCNKCGKVQKSNGKIEHDITCSARDRHSDENLVECVYLYREFSSEAIRILLPMTTFSGSDRKLHSFIAALQLGLKLYFRGKIDHLQATVYEEPVPESSIRKKYLLLFDTVPGGTGYLKELMRDKDRLPEVLDTAKTALASCDCTRDPSKDGCYRCLFAYRSSYNMETTSRDTAIELLSDILKHRDKFVPVENLKKISITGLLGSELEARFLESLRRLSERGYRVMLKKDVVNNKPGYYFKIDEQAYYIEPQVKLGEEDGVLIPSTADFVFRPARQTGTAKPIAVFTDGFFYHKDRIGKDMAQRTAIAQSGNFHVWSLTWKDVENRFFNQGSFFVDFLDPSNRPLGDTLRKALTEKGLHDFVKLPSNCSYDWFAKFLSGPDEKRWARFAFFAFVTFLDFQRFSDPHAVEAWRGDLSNFVTDDIVDLDELTGSLFYGLYEPRGNSSVPQIRLFAAAEQSVIQNENPAGAMVVCGLMDSEESRSGNDFESAWVGYLRLHNIFQFLPRTVFVTQEGLAGKVHRRIRPTMAVSVDAPTTVADGEWRELKDLCDAELHELLDALAEAGVPVPEAGFELLDSDGIVRGEAELGWSELRVAFLDSGREAYRPVFEAAGWCVVALTEVLNNPGACMSLFNVE